MGFSIFKSKAPEPVAYDYKLQEVFNEVVSCFQENYPKEVEEAKEAFVRLTGPFDEEHEYFESKLDDFRSWFLFFYKGPLFSNLEKIKSDKSVGKYYDYLISGLFSNFMVHKIKDNEIIFKDLSDNIQYKVENNLRSLGVEKGDCIQTSLFYIKEGLYEMGPSMVVHPSESLKYIKKKTKEVVKGTGLSQEELFERLISMRYQFFKYKQLEIEQIYSDKSPLFEKISDHT